MHLKCVYKSISLILINEKIKCQRHFEIKTNAVFFFLGFPIPKIILDLLMNKFLFN